MRNRLVLLLSVVILLVLSSCHTRHYLRDINNDTVAFVRGIGPRWPAPIFPVPVRGISYSDHAYDTGVGAYGYVLINDPADARNKDLSEAYFNIFATYNYAKRKQKIATVNLLVPTGCITVP